jgi:hypothetical protein
MLYPIPGIAESNVIKTFRVRDDLYRPKIQVYYLGDRKPDLFDESDRQYVESFQEIQLQTYLDWGLQQFGPYQGQRIADYPKYTLSTQIASCEQANRNLRKTQNILALLGIGGSIALATTGHEHLAIASGAALFATEGMLATVHSNRNSKIESAKTELGYIRMLHFYDENRLIFENLLDCICDDKASQTDAKYTKGAGIISANNIDGYTIEDLIKIRNDAVQYKISRPNLSGTFTRIRPETEIDVYNIATGQKRLTGPNAHII